MNEEIAGKIAGWSAEDQAWLGKLPPELQGVAADAGRDLLQIVMQAGAVSYALGVLWRQVGRNTQGREATVMVQQTLDSLCRRAVAGAGKEMGDFAAVKAGVEAVAAMGGEVLQKPEGMRVNPGGILLDY